MDEKPDILIIEDDESTRKTLTLVLGKKGYPLVDNFRTFVWPKASDLE